MGVVPGQVGGDELIGHQAGLVRFASKGGADALDEGVQTIGVLEAHVAEPRASAPTQAAPFRASGLRSTDMWSIHEALALLGSRELSATELVNICAQRISDANPALNAFVHLDVAAGARTAAAVDEARARGDAVGPLAGIPFGVKDLEDCAGMPTSKGSRRAIAHRAAGTLAWRWGYRWPRPTRRSMTTSGSTHAWKGSTGGSACPTACGPSAPASSTGSCVSAGTPVST
jgi:hypothetical protein